MRRRRRLEWFRFKIGGRAWRVVFEPRLMDLDTGAELLGLCDFERCMIRLSAAQPMPDVCATLLHELMHCAGQSYVASESDPTAEERFICASEVRLWAIIVQFGFAPPPLPNGFDSMQRDGMAARGLL